MTSGGRSPARSRTGSGGAVTARGPPARAADHPLFTQPGHHAGSDRRIPETMKKPAAPKRHLPTSPFKAPVITPCEQYAVGDRVIHDVYGLGKVIGVEDEVAVFVDFGSQQERIPSPFVKMSHL
jgi:hypothetical protein